MKFKKIAATLAATVLTLAATACGSGAGSGAQADSGPQDVTLMLNWYPYGEHAPFYYGLDQGIFAKYGINLTVKAGQGSTKTAQAVGSKQVDFGWADTPAVLANIDKGMPIKSVGVFLQTTPSAVQVFADKNINSVADLKGKTIAVSAGDAPTTTFPIFLQRSGLQPNDVKQQNLDAAGKISAMMSGQVDGLIGFAHDQGPTIANKSGKEVKYFRYSDAGLSFYSNGLVVNNALAKEKPELAKKMVAATSEAFAAAQAKPQDAVKSMVGKDPQMPPEPVLLDQWQETTKLLETSATRGKAPGTNADSDWQATIQVLSEAKLIESAKPVDTYFDKSAQPAGS
ncbi:sulfonate ABC transporter substrate-binding protein [Enemella evansiae]|uniref:ABC transporter substrate-binding protein n=1 Tax=Enemella evansiae TaxID=2016499 RepID=UPI000B9760A5|nr:ABC transporter substrate-binding protein [Enemella evansiae]OYO16836.1 sulfonate ABC transporter substrate-binding protein [Enemella evansiae]